MSGDLGLDPENTVHWWEKGAHAEDSEDPEKWGLRGALWKNPEKIEQKLMKVA